MINSQQVQIEKIALIYTNSEKLFKITFTPEKIQNEKEKNAFGKSQAQRKTEKHYDLLKVNENSHIVNSHSHTQKSHRNSYTRQ